MPLKMPSIFSMLLKMGLYTSYLDKEEGTSLVLKLWWDYSEISEHVPTQHSPLGWKEVNSCFKDEATQDSERSGRIGNIFFIQ